VVDTNLTAEEIIENYIAEREKVNHKDHIIQSDEHNEELTLTESLKDFLSNIPMGKRFMEWREAYIRALQLMEGTQAYSDGWTDQIVQSWKQQGEDPRAAVVRNEMIRVIKRTFRTTRETDGAAILRNMKFINENMFFYHKGNDLTEVAGEEGAKQAGAVIMRRDSGESTRGFLIRIETELGIDHRDTHDHFLRYQSADVVRGFVNNFVSQKVCGPSSICRRKQWGPVTVSLPG